MKKYLFLILLGLNLSAKAALAYINDVSVVLNKLDEIVLNSGEYRMEKERRLKEMQNRFEKQLSKEDRYYNNKILYEEYYVYDSDSAMVCVDENLEIASLLGRTDWVMEWRIKKSFLLSATGLLKEAEEQLKQVDRSVLTGDLLTDYYGQMVYLWSHFSQYVGSQSDEVQRSYLDKEKLYRDSVYQVVGRTHSLYLWYKGCYYQSQGVDAMKGMVAELASALEKENLSTRYDAMNAYILGGIYRDLGDTDNYIKCLAYSAIADIVSCNRDIASLEELGMYLFELGDIDRAYVYLNYCLQHALLYKNRVRVMGVSAVIDEINVAYQEQLRMQKRSLRFYLVIVSVLSVILFLAVIYIYKKMNQLSVSRIKLKEMNDDLNSHIKTLSETQAQLKGANEQLCALNEELKSVNGQLRESNYTKEEYIGYVFSICSNYIGKLDEYRKNINRKIRTNQIEEVKVLTDTPTMAQKELRDFYRNFDEIFLHVYPNFVEDFNSLLNPEERIVLKEGELLNTELRIYALVRLGINDSVKIAEFLHCSPQTVYNNRLRVRNKSDIPKGQFAETVRSLGKPLI